jgi:hypothetical protein
MAPVFFPSRVERVFHVKYRVSLRFDLFYFLSFSPSLITSGIRACSRLGFLDVANDEVRSTAVGLQDEVLAVASEDAAQTQDLDEALEKFGGKSSKDWNDEEKRKDRKALSLIQLHLSNDILQECLQEETAAALWLKLELICMSKDLTSKMHMKMKLFTLKMEEG